MPDEPKHWLVSHVDTGELKVIANALAPTDAQEALISWEEWGASLYDRLIKTSPPSDKSNIPFWIERLHPDKLNDTNYILDGLKDLTEHSQTENLCALIMYARPCKHTQVQLLRVGLAWGLTSYTEKDVQEFYGPFPLKPEIGLPYEPLYTEARQGVSFDVGTNSEMGGVVYDCLHELGRLQLDLDAFSALELLEYFRNWTVYQQDVAMHQRVSGAP